ncbi:hypothetical protein PQJ75_29800 [Rhodoplanes sp. TEM]|uniref:Uncharacterized protein n=1 Tax=Rhodoplanes tepidamans TaxID=200616 RepID=A0ABT5JIL9_RHOTP|nr:MULTISPECIES: hypothetical protein [Rhodoplanes]MDC7788870.1 hypothetical protein [Rhodoplanes tepidamans]MDC7987948.1 hypothetical protein [Rhodoplanes sp. TEM]MDQ0355106.1 hypothetical protein [Rhodoplanes tepidamans]
MAPTHHSLPDDPPTAVLAILDTFRRHPNAVSERARETLKSFGLIDSAEGGATRTAHRC